MLEAIDGKPVEDGFSSKNDKSKTLLLKTKKVSYINTVERQKYLKKVLDIVVNLFVN